MNQDEIWYGAERLGALFKLLSPKLRKKRQDSYLKGCIDRYQDYLTSDESLSDEEIVERGGDILRIYRLVSSVESLYGKPIDEGITQHAIFREAEDLFSNDRGTFETAEFNVFSAAFLRERTGLDVTLLRERKGERTPDLRVGDLSYVECKDLQSVRRENLTKNLEENLTTAVGQLAAAQSRTALPAAGVCIDVPYALWPMDRASWAPIANALGATTTLTFVVVSASGIVVQGGEIGFPHTISLVTRPDVPEAVQGSLLRVLATRSVRTRGNGFELIVHESGEHVGSLESDARDGV